MENMEEKPKRTRRKKVEEPKPVEVPEVAEVQEIEADVPKTNSKAVVEQKANKYRVRVKTALLNVREKASKASVPIRIAKAGDILTIVELAGEWAKLEGEGYVMNEFIERIDG